MVAPGRMVTSSRRIGRVTNKTKLIIYRGSDKVDTSAAETVLWDQEAGGAGKDSTKHQHIDATGVESGELLVRIRMCSFTFHYAWEGVALGGSRENGPLIAGVFFFPPLDERRSARGGTRRRGRMFSSIHAFCALFFLRAEQDRRWIHALHASGQIYRSIQPAYTTQDACSGRLTGISVFGNSRFVCLSYN